MSMLVKLRKIPYLVRFTPPGFPCSIDVPFPERLLPVCDKCKKNFKTREHCRGRECHTSLPWSEVFVCITLDPSCTNEDNALAPGPFIARPIPPQPFCLPENLDPGIAICTLCKDKNYTRGYCRGAKKHRNVPWSTVYVVLSYDPNAPPTAAGNYENISNRSRRSKRLKVENAAEEEITEDDSEKITAQESDKSPEDEDKDDSAENPNSFFTRIPDSRTFLMTTSHSSSAVTWLDLDPNFVRIERPYPGDMSTHQRGVGELRMHPMYGHMPPPIDPRDIYPPTTMPGHFQFVSKQNWPYHAAEFPLQTRGPHYPYPSMDPYFDPVGYNLGSTMPYSPGIDRYLHSASTAMYLGTHGAHHDDVSAMSRHPAVLGDPSMQRSLPWENGHVDHSGGRQSTIMYPGLWQGAPVGNSENRQYPSSFRSPPTPEQNK